MISADVMRGLALSGYPVGEACVTCGRRADPTLETLINWLVQRRVREVVTSIAGDGSWSALARWPGPDRELSASGQSAADAVAKIVLEVASIEPSPRRA